MTTYNKKFYKIDRVNIDINSRSTFQNAKGESITFANYYKTRYNTNVQTLDAPLLESKLLIKSKG